MVVAALIYLPFVLTAGLDWVVLEAGGVLLFGVLAYAGVRGPPILLALGWTAHVVWDVALHLVTGQVIVPRWYPSLCITFDIFVVAYIVWRLGVLQDRQEAA